ncbi:MAG: hypothetical protein RLZZ53_231, partial [Acidobacteriota bacterium]
MAQLTRREMLELAAAAAVVSTGSAAAAQSAGTLRFF